MLYRQVHGAFAIKTQGARMTCGMDKLDWYTQGPALSVQINSRFLKKNKNNLRQNHVTTLEKLKQTLAHG